MTKHRASDQCSNDYQLSPQIAAFPPATHSIEGQDQPVQAWQLRGGGVSLELVQIGHELPRITSWGPAAAGGPACPQGPGETAQTARDLYLAAHPQRVSGALDETCWPSILPTAAEPWIGSPRLSLTRQGQEIFPAFHFEQAEITSAPAVDPLPELVETLLEGTDTAPAPSAETGESWPTLLVSAQDAEQKVRLEWWMQITPAGLLRQKARLTNLAQEATEVRTLELSFPVPALATEMLSTTGHHLRERSPQRQEIRMGRVERTSYVGRPDFDATGVLCAGQRGFDFEEGQVWAVHCGWSGSVLHAVEALPYCQTLLSGAEVLAGGEITLQTGESYESPWLYGAWGQGLNEISARFHHLLRTWHPELVEKRRPVLLNTWEAVYFDHDEQTLMNLADEAARAGIERFVVDDGWFHLRRDDRAGLGDWQVDEAVWPRGLGPLAQHVHDLGMEFGLWFEPEMINPDSDLARAHPEWILAPTPQRHPLTGRFQQVLDLSQTAAARYIFECMDKLVGELGIDYIKWDHNRFVTEARSAASGRVANHEQVQAVYAIFAALKARHPGLEIESCSSGGGRIDLGIMRYADRVWVSDCVDPVERADIQRYTSILIPPLVMGQHIGDSPAHSTGRATTFTLRAATAFFGHLGVEWNLLKVARAELDQLGQWVRWYQSEGEWMRRARHVHGSELDPAVRLDGMVSDDGQRALYRFTQLTSSVHYPPQPLRLPGLDPQRYYRVRPAELCQDMGHHATGQSPLGWWNSEGAVLRGDQLLNWGLAMPQLHPATAVIFSAEALFGG